MPRRCKSPFVGLLMVIILLLAGCGTTQDHRIRVYARDFRSLDDDRQTMIREGRIDRGFTPREVYMALGEPRERRTGRTAAGEHSVWLYVGLIRDDDEDGPIFRTTSDLIWGSPLRRQAYDRLLVFFEDGEVTGKRAVPRAP